MSAFFLQFVPWLMEEASLWRDLGCGGDCWRPVPSIIEVPCHGRGHVFVESLDDEEDDDWDQAFLEMEEETDYMYSTREHEVKLEYRAESSSSSSEDGSSYSDQAARAWKQHVKRPSEQTTSRQDPWRSYWDFKLAAYD